MKQDVPSPYQQLVYDVRKGDTILIDDGLIGLEVQRVSATRLSVLSKTAVSWVSEKASMFQM